MPGDREAVHALEDSELLTAGQRNALLRLVEEAPAVVRRHQFFYWLQCHVHGLLSHALAACGAYQRQRRDIVYDVFCNVVLPPDVLGLLHHNDSPVIAALVRLWQQRRCRAYALNLGGADDFLLQPEGAPLLDAGVRHVVVHGVARPQRPTEVESMFIFVGMEAADVQRSAARMELLLPHLHAAWLRVQNLERELGPASAAPPTPPPPDAPRLPITPREREILEGVRQGKSNVQIGLALGISGLTVKNHVQKILRKLGAHTRAQAVAMTMGQAPDAGSGRAARLALPSLGDAVDGDGDGARLG